MLFTITKLSSLSRHSDSGAQLRKHDTASKKRRETGESSRGMLFLSKICKFYCITYTKLKQLLDNFLLIFYWTTNQVFNAFTLNCLQLAMWNHVTCDVINCNGSRPHEHLTCAGGRRSFKPNPSELDSVHQAKEKCQKNHEALTRNFNKNHLYLTLRYLTIVWVFVSLLHSRF